MKGQSLAVLAVLLQPYGALGRKVKPDPVGEPGKEPYIQGESVHWGTGRLRGSYHCDVGETPFITPDRTSATCCRAGESLKGSEATEWHCCAENHDVAGSAAVGYECCVDGSVFDGKMCKKPTTCENGMEMVDGKCQCPQGQELSADGTCRLVKPAKCDSGLKTGEFILRRLHLHLLQVALT